MFQLIETVTTQFSWVELGYLTSSLDSARRSVEPTLLHLLELRCHKQQQGVTATIECKRIAAFHCMPIVARCLDVTRGSWGTLDGSCFTGNSENERCGEDFTNDDKTISKLKRKKKDIYQSRWQSKATLRYLREIGRLHLVEQSRDNPCFIGQDYLTQSIALCFANLPCIFEDFYPIALDLALDINPYFTCTEKSPLEELSAIAKHYLARLMNDAIYETPVSKQLQAQAVRIAEQIVLDPIRTNQIELGVLEENLSPPDFMLRHNPVFGGLSMFELLYKIRRIAVTQEEDVLQVIIVLHVYHMLRQSGHLTETWEDAEACLNNLGPGTIFGCETRPTQWFMIHAAYEAAISPALGQSLIEPSELVTKIHENVSSGSRKSPSDLQNYMIEIFQDSQLSSSQHSANGRNRTPSIRKMSTYRARQTVQLPSVARSIVSNI